MNRVKLALSGLLLCTVLLASTGCDEGQDVGMVGGHIYPPKGSFVHVQFRRDYLGFAGDKGSSPVVGTDPGVALASSGELRNITEEFIVLAVADEPDRELWIPRGNILLLDVKRESQPQPE